jgi:hypothetical protein
LVGWAHSAKQFFVSTGSHPVNKTKTLCHNGGDDDNNNNNNNDDDNDDEQPPSNF